MPVDGPRRRFTLLALALLLGALAWAPPARAVGVPVGDTKNVCAYSAHSVATLESFGRLVGRDMDCAVVFNDSAPTWAEWETPWFLHHGDPNFNWANWVAGTAKPRKLVITQNLFPTSENGTDWLHAGARGDYDAHARALARNLVAAGLGNSVIRLAHEANGTWYPDSVGTSAADQALWKAFWRRTVLAMRSVPGAAFRFDWCINAAYRAIPLASWYPGDDVVDIVGIDAYDAGIPAGQQGWPTVYNRTLGLSDVESFAKAHNKALSIPEWGVGAANGSSQAKGDDPQYVDGIARVVRTDRVAYEGYFFKYEWADTLTNGPLSLAEYRRHFGTGGDATPEGMKHKPKGGGTAAPVVAAAPKVVAAAPKVAPKPIVRPKPVAPRATVPAIGPGLRASLRRSVARALAGVRVARRARRVTVAVAPGRNARLCLAGVLGRPTAHAAATRRVRTACAKGRRATGGRGTTVLAAGLARPGAKRLTLRVKAVRRRPARGARVAVVGVLVARGGGTFAVTRTR